MMRISGVAILRNAVSLEYPFRESLRSLSPLVEELIVNVGQGEDGTFEAVQELCDPKIKAFRSEWDLRPRDGLALSEQTNLALDRASGDWIVYLQADEVLHEDDLQVIRTNIEMQKPSTEGLVFDYLHFHTSPHVINDDWLTFYPRAVRAVRGGIGIVSSGDAAGFVRRTAARTRGLIKARAGARIFHYGWADPSKQARARALSSLYHDRFDASPVDLFPADLTVHPHLRRYQGEHPQTMKAWVSKTHPPGAVRPYRSPAWLRAWFSFLGSPRRFADPARPFLPLWLTNMKWRLEERRASLMRARRAR